ncbi:MAG: hypothetical protein WDO18_06330 [Acidobacteriota bacterium]
MRGAIKLTTVLAAASLVLAGSEIARERQDPVSKLDRKLGARKASLEYSDGWGYLRSMLKQLDINTDSQILVFSKTSFQQDLISAAKPRALYFNDDIVIGAVQDASVFEVVSLDPTEGLQFFSLDQKKTGKPRFKAERGSCTFCHGPINKWAQGVMIATVFPAPDGKPTFSPGELFHLTDHRSPFEDRWGGYYVTGTSGGIKHRGNAIAPDPSRPMELDTTNSSNVTSLTGRFDIAKYLEPTSDIVALMTLEHQTMMTNILTSLGAQFRANADFPLPAEQLDAEVDKLVKFMLFVDETKLISPIKGVSTFTQTFAQRGPRDRKGRSLRDFDLQTRMFRYPLSYMIYSRGFDGLSQDARDRVYRRLYEVLTGKITSGGYDQLDAERRREILEILIETKPGLPAYFKL